MNEERIKTFTSEVSELRVNGARGDRERVLLGAPPTGSAIRSLYWRRVASSASRWSSQARHCSSATPSPGSCAIGSCAWCMSSVPRPTASSTPSRAWAGLRWEGRTLIRRRWPTSADGAHICERVRRRGGLVSPWHQFLDKTGAIRELLRSSRMDTVRKTGESDKL
jgi:hypothetical protein